eukprot:327199-Hanusia_phi.AAC.3
MSTVLIFGKRSMIHFAFAAMQPLSRHLLLLLPVLMVSTTTIFISSSSHTCTHEPHLSCRRPHHLQTHYQLRPVIFPCRQSQLILRLTASPLSRPSRSPLPPPRLPLVSSWSLPPPASSCLLLPQWCTEGADERAGVDADHAPLRQRLVGVLLRISRALFSSSSNLPAPPCCVHVEALGDSSAPISALLAPILLLLLLLLLFSSSSSSSSSFPSYLPTSDCRVARTTGIS